MENTENKYIDLLFHCIKLKQDDILFLECNYSNQEFIDKIVNAAKKLGVNKVILYIENDEEDKKMISELSIDEIKKHPRANTSVYDEWANKGAKFLRILSPKPGYYEGLDEEKVAALLNERKRTRPIYYKKLHEKKLIWNISLYPNQEWADFLFPNEQNNFFKLFDLIISACGADKKDPKQFWDDEMESQKNRIDILNKLNISSLHYKNNLGTDLTVMLTKDTIWTSISDWDGYIVNLPSYEIFSNLDYRKTNGILYSSKPLVYNNIIIEDFWLKFENGKIVDYYARKGLQALKTIIETDKLTHYLGEIAIVSIDNPINRLYLNFYETLLDENCRSHFSIGSGEIECVKNIEGLNDKELNELGINTSSNHVDFMIGTDDLEITADTNKGKVIILKNGRWNI